MTKDRKMTNRIFRGTFFRYLLCYMVYLVILLVVMIVFYLQNVRYWQENKLRQYEEILVSRAEGFRQQLSNLSTLRSHLEGDSRYQTFSRQKYNMENADYVKTAMIQKDFNGAMIPYSLVSDSGIWFRNGIIITRWQSFVGSQGAEDYYKSYFHVKEDTEEEWFAFLSSREGGNLRAGVTVFSYTYGESEALVWKEAMHFGTLYVVMKKDDLARFFLPEELREEGYFYVVDAEGENCLSYQYGMDTEPSSFYEISYHDPYTDLAYRIGVPRIHVDILMRALIQGMVVYGVLVLVGGALLAVLFAWQNNRPIRRLAISASAYDGRPPAEGTAWNGYDYVARVMERQQSSLEKVQEQLEQKKAEEKRHFLDKAIQGGLNSNDLVEQFVSFFPDCRETCRIVILILMEEPRGTEEIQLSRNLLVQQALWEFYGYDITITSTYPDILVYVLPGVLERSMQEKGKTTAGELDSFLENSLGQQVQVSVSEPFSQVLEMPWAYISTLYQFQARTEEGEASQETGYGKGAFRSFNFMYCQQLFEALSNGEEAIAVSLIRKIESDIVSAASGFEDRQLGEAVCRSFYTSNLSGLYSIFIQVKLNYFEILNGVSIPIFSSFQEVSAYFEALVSCCQQICGKLEEHKKRFRKRQLHRQVMEFLESHITDSNLSAQMAADHFHISYNTLQKIIRNDTGGTLAEYVEGRRIEIAVRLLQNTEDSVESVALQSGFSSYNSMYKVFKRQYHLSPREAAEAAKTAE